MGPLGFEIVQKYPVRVLKEAITNAVLHRDYRLPLYITRPLVERESVTVVLLNENRPSAWEQVSNYLDRHGVIGNKEIRQVLRTDDTLRASRRLKEWVDRGLLVVTNPHQGTKVRRYCKPGFRPEIQLFAEQD